MNAALFQGRLPYVESTVLELQSDVSAGASEIGEDEVVITLSSSHRASEELPRR